MTAESPHVRKNGLFYTLLIALLVCFIGYGLSARNYVKHYAFQIHNGQALTIVMARDESIKLSLEIAEDALSSDWATGSQGLVLKLGGVKESLLVVPPKAQTWEDAVETLKDPSEKYVRKLTVEGTVTIPSSVGGPEQRTLLGTISGSVIYPIKADRRNFDAFLAFEDKVLEVSVPVQIKLISQSSRFWSGGRGLFVIFAGGEIFCCALLMLLSVLALWRTHIFFSRSVIARLLELGILASFIALIPASIAWLLLTMLSLAYHAPLSLQVVELNIILVVIVGLSLGLVLLHKKPYRKMKKIEA